MYIVTNAVTAAAPALWLQDWLNWALELLADRQALDRMQVQIAWVKANTSPSARKIFGDKAPQWQRGDAAGISAIVKKVATERAGIIGLRDPYSEMLGFTRYSVCGLPQDPPFTHVCFSYPMVGVAGEPLYDETLAMKCIEMIEGYYGYVFAYEEAWSTSDLPQEFIREAMEYKKNPHRERSIDPLVRARDHVRDLFFENILTRTHLARLGVDEPRCAPPLLLETGRTRNGTELFNIRVSGRPRTLADDEIAVLERAIGPLLEGGTSSLA